ncbi:hypothetical protein AA0614_0479 [Komagataeibacter saccharivorans NRIC 0614]|nr:hypothetical protein AA0614_0479 [Komagataeibacter saccharivorans NRIC 0614]
MFVSLPGNTHVGVETVPLARCRDNPARRQGQYRNAGKHHNMHKKKVSPDSGFHIGSDYCPADPLQITDT